MSRRVPAPPAPRLVAALAGLLAATGIARAELPPVPILTGPVTVTAFFADSVRPDLPTEVRLEVRQDAACWQLPTTPWGLRTTDEAIARLKRGIGWKDGYLFVRTECGQGNAWKCRQEVVFAKRAGRLVPLAKLMPTADAIGSSRDRGRFHDVDVDFEINDVTSHAGAPAFPLVLRDDGTTLVVDLDRSWKEAEPRFARNRAGIEALRDSAATPAVTITRRDLLYGDAVIAAYFRRPAELIETLEQARRWLDPETARRIQRAADGVRPGVLPRTSRPDLRRCGDEEE